MSIAATREKIVVIKRIRMSISSLALAALLAVPVPQALAVDPVPEIPDFTLPDIAMVRFTDQGPIIVYNPNLCRQAGEKLCAFYRAHEYGHIAMGHDDRDDISVREKEREADEWAAKHASPQSVRTAMRFFESGGGGTPMHGSGDERSARLKEHSGL